MAGEGCAAGCSQHPSFLVHRRVFGTLREYSEYAIQGWEFRVVVWSKGARTWAPRGPPRRTRTEQHTVLRALGDRLSVISSLPPSSLQREPSIVAGVPEDGGRRTQRRRQVLRQPNPLPLILLHHVHPFIPRPRRSRAQVGPSSAKRASEKKIVSAQLHRPRTSLSPLPSRTPQRCPRGVCKLSYYLTWLINTGPPGISSIQKDRFGCGPLLSLSLGFALIIACVRPQEGGGGEGKAGGGGETDREACACGEE